MVLEVKNPPANVGDAGDMGSIQEDPLEKKMATHSSILAWKIPWTEVGVHGENLLGRRLGGDDCDARPGGERAEYVGLDAEVVADYPWLVVGGW